MPEYRKKPVVIEAFQMTKERRWDNREWPDWLNQAWNTHGMSSLFIDPNDPERARLCVYTLNGPVHLAWGDWIIRGVQGELYPCEPDIFAATYEEASDA